MKFLIKVIIHAMNPGTDITDLNNSLGIIVFEKVMDLKFTPTIGMKFIREGIIIDNLSYDCYAESLVTELEIRTSEVGIIKEITEYRLKRFTIDQAESTLTLLKKYECS